MIIIIIIIIIISVLEVLDWCVGSLIRVRFVWTFARASFNLMRRCGWTRWSVSLFPDDGDYCTDVISSLHNVRSAIWSKGILELGVGSCRCWLVPVVLSECRLDVFASKEWKLMPNMTLRVHLCCRSVDVSFLFVRFP